MHKTLWVVLSETERIESDDVVWRSLASAYKQSIVFTTLLCPQNQNKTSLTNTINNNEAKTYLNKRFGILLVRWPPSLLTNCVVIIAVSCLPKDSVRLLSACSLPLFNIWANNNRTTRSVMREVCGKVYGIPAELPNGSVVPINKSTYCRVSSFVPCGWCVWTMTENVQPGGLINLVPLKGYHFDCVLFSGELSGLHLMRKEHNDEQIIMHKTTNGYLIITEEEHFEL